MKILQLVKTSDAAEWAEYQMSTLVKEGYEVHVAMPVGGRMTEKYQKDGVVVHHLDYSLKKIFVSIRNLRRIVKEVQPDIIHSHFYICTLIMRLGLRRYNIPRVFQLPGPSHLYYPLLKRIDISLAQKDKDYWVGSCKYSCDLYLKSGIDKERVHLSYYLAPKFDKSPYKDEKKLRKEMGLPDSAIMIGMISYMYPPKYYVGQIRGIKGHEDFIEAISIASKVNPNIYGLCVGGVWNGHVGYEKRIHRFAKKRTDHIVFCGNRNDVPQIYPELFCAVQPSHQENLGGAAQAFFNGCPIISSNAGGLPEIVIDGVTGYLFPVKDSKALAEAIIKMVNDPENAHQMMINGQELMSRIMESNVGSIENVYSIVLNKRNN